MSLRISLSVQNLKDSLACSHPCTLTGRNDSTRRVLLITFHKFELSKFSQILPQRAASDRVISYYRHSYPASLPSLVVESA